jgi:hypothetical protein
MMKDFTNTESSPPADRFITSKLIRSCLGSECPENLDKGMNL